MGIMNYVFNSTADYHRHMLDSLGWELTMCNCLESPESPCRKFLGISKSYGSLLYDFLQGAAGMPGIEKVLEVGGGYGFLMRDFLERGPLLRAAMLDISPVLLRRQREALAGAAAQGRVDFIEKDFLETSPELPASFDLVIMNENLGDFPTLDGLARRFFYSPPKQFDRNLATARGYFVEYNFDLPGSYPFSFNLGACQAVEKLCRCGVKHIFLSEHSCEAACPGTQGAHSAKGASPNRIKLKGHDEYTVKFSYLERIALRHGYSCLRGPMADYIQVDPALDLRAAVSENEAARHFLDDLYKYEYLLLTRKA